MQNNGKLKKEDEYQEIILELCLQIIDENHPITQEICDIFIKAIDDYMLMDPEYCDLSTSLFVQYVWDTYIRNDRVLRIPDAYHTIVQAFIYRQVKREIIKIEKTSRSSNPLVNNVYNVYQYQFLPNRVKDRDLSFNINQDPIVQQKIEQLLLK